jgi:hypothetical protein
VIIRQVKYFYEIELTFNSIFEEGLRHLTVINRIAFRYIIKEKNNSLCIVVYYLIQLHFYSEFILFIQINIQMISE